MIPFELADSVLAEARATQRRLRDLPSRVGVYFVLAICLFPAASYQGVWAKLTGALESAGGVPCPTRKALRNLRRRGFDDRVVQSRARQDGCDGHVRLRRSFCPCLNRAYPATSGFSFHDGSDAQVAARHRYRSALQPTSTAQEPVNMPGSRKCA